MERNGVRVLFISNEFPSPVDPNKAVFNRSTTGALAREHDVRVIAPVPWVDEWRARRRGARLQSRSRVLDGADVVYPRYYYTPRMLRRWYGQFYWLSARSEILSALNRKRPDIVVAYWAYPDGAAAVRAARLAGVPCTIIVGGSDVLLLGNNRTQRRNVAKVLRAADAVITLSSDLREKIIELGVGINHVHLWTRGMDDGFCPGDRAEARRLLDVPEDQTMFLWVGRMVPVKGLDVLIEACRMVKEDGGARFCACLVGDGPLRESLQAMCAAAGLADSIRFVGARPHNELPAWYRAADATVLPSLSEGLPNVLRESAACGTRFIASRVGGIPEIVGEADRLCEPGDPQSLASALTDLIKHRFRPSTHVAHSLSWERSAYDLTQILEACRVNGRAPVPV